MRRLNAVSSHSHTYRTLPESYDRYHTRTVRIAYPRGSVATLVFPLILYLTLTYPAIRDAGG